MTAMPAEPGDETEVPVFGSEDDYATGPRFPLRLTVKGPRGVEQVELAGSGKPSGGALLEMSAAQRRTTLGGKPDEAALAAASERIIREMLVDDDGVPVGWQPPPAGGDTWSDWQGREVATYEAALPPDDECSSQRRFQLLIMSPAYKVDLGVLIKMARWLAEKGSQPVPTPAPTRSARGRSPSGQRSGRGRAASR